ncbi:MAG: hypothetical protein ACRCU1_15235 [Alsobacter sp.]
MARVPINTPTIRVTPNGRFGSVRTDPSRGRCGAKGYPCTHSGVDLAAPRGTEVIAPESGLIVEVGLGDKAPWRGYDPGVLLLLGDGTLSGGKRVWHLLGHLDGDDLVERWGEVPILGTKPKLYPLAHYVTEGEVLGKVGIDHTHWEVRDARLGTRMNPAYWWSSNNQQIPEDDRYRTAQILAVTSDDVDAGGGGDGDGGDDDGLVVLGLLALWAWRG